MARAPAGSGLNGPTIVARVPDLFAGSLFERRSLRLNRLNVIFLFFE